MSDLLLLRSSVAIFLSPSSLPLFLLLSTLLFSFRSGVHLGTLSLSSALDRDPHLRPLLSRLSSLHTAANHHHHNPNPSASSALLSSSSPDLHPLPRHHLHTNLSVLISSAPNLTALRLKLPNPPPPVLLLLSHPATASAHLDRRDALSLLYMAFLFTVAHLYALIGFLFSYSCAFGVVSLAATSSLLGRPSASLRQLYIGSRLGLRRLPLLLFLRWSLRDALVQFLCILFFSDVRDQFSLLKLFLKLKLIPFSLTALPPSVVADASTLKPFLSTWTFLDMPVSAIFAVNCWVALMDRSDRRTGKEIVKEGCYLMSTMIGKVGFIKLLEMMVCGSFGMRLMSAVGIGQVLAMIVQSVAEVYFMVVWLLFYFSARSNVGDSDGRRFSWRDLEELYDRLREDRRHNE